MTSKLFVNSIGAMQGTNIAVDSDVTVGLNNITPTSQLNVGGDMLVGNPANSYTDIRLQSSATPNGTTRIRADANNHLVTYVDDAETTRVTDGGHFRTNGGMRAYAGYLQVRDMVEVHEPIPYTYNDGSYKRYYNRLATFGSSGQAELQFRLHFQGDHNYNHLFTCAGQIHQWGSSTGNVNFYIWGLGGNLTGNFRFTSGREIYWQPSGLWSYTARLEVLSKNNCTIDCNTNAANPGGTTYSVSGQGNVGNEIVWGA